MEVWRYGGWRRSDGKELWMLRRFVYAISVIRVVRILHLVEVGAAIILHAASIVAVAGAIGLIRLKTALLAAELRLAEVTRV